MTVTYDNGSQTATLDTPHQLPSTAITADGTYQLQVDCNAMVAGDITIIRAYLKVRSSGTTRLLYADRLAHVPAAPVYVTIPIASTNELYFTLEQTDGTGRAYPWEIVQLDA
jgi:hypothetical protein